MENGIELYLQPDGFYAGRLLKNGRMAKGSHLITEDEIITMFTTLMRAYTEKTGNDSMILKGDDGNAVISKLVKLKSQ